ncbi:Rieske (2Fe-2S) protein [Streptomyces sp. NPDC001719]
MTQRRPRPRPYDRELESLRLLGGNGRQEPCPTGWYFARFSKHLRPGQVVPVTYMSRQYALFRTRGGAVGMIDSQCCHMGADLSRCGKVREERLVCGFHAWEFGTDGVCRKLPGADRIPARAVQHSLSPRFPGIPAPRRQFTLRRRGTPAPTSGRAARPPPCAGAGAAGRTAAP